MRKLTLYFETVKGKRIKNMIIGCGASIVLLGALFKIQHYPGAGIMLVIGMSIEAFIFALQGILPPHKDFYWEKLYPNLDLTTEEEETLGGGSVVAQLDKGLTKARLGSEVIESLGDNLQKLGDNVSKMSDITDASVATNEYSETARHAAKTLNEMSEAYGHATDAVL